MRKNCIARPRPHSCVILTAVFCLGWPMLASGATSAEQLANRVPEGTLAFIATSGIEELKPAFEKTVLNQFLNDPNVRSVIDKVTALIENEINVKSNDPTAKAILQAFKTAYRRPILAGISQDMSESKSDLYGFVFIDAGPQKEQMDSALRKVEDSGGQDSFVDRKVDGLTIRMPKDANGPPAYWGWIDRVLVIGLNDTQRLAIKGLGTRRSTSLPRTLQGLPYRGDALVIHADLKRLHALMMSKAKENGDPEILRVVTALSKELALSDLQALAIRSGFQDKGSTVDGLLQTANPKGPIMRLIRPADLSMLDAMDSNTISAEVWNLDLAGLYDLVMQTAKAVAPMEDYADFEKGLAELEGKLGFKIRQDLLASLAGPISLCTVEVPGSTPPTGGSILTAKLRQPEMVDKALAALAKIAVDESKGSVQAGTTVQDGYTVRCIGGTSLALVQIMPTWVLAKDRLILATNTALCTQALRQFVSGTSPKTPLRTTAAYKQVCGKMPNDVSHVKFVDSPRQFRQILLAIRPYWPLVTVAVAKVGIQLPMALPTFDRIADQMPPSGCYCWQDKDGLRWHSEGSSIDATAMAGAAVGAGVMMPALAKARTQASRVVSMNNLKQIALGCIMYADDNKGAFPPSLQSLVDKGLIQAKALQSPRKSSAEGKPFYVYVNGQTTKMDPQNIVAYEDPNQAMEGVNAAFMDGHVEFLKREAFQKRLEETYKRLGREMPK
jgi:prepilin-type processing-associated H-X9-DG protein